MDINAYLMRLVKLRMEKGISARELSLRLGQNPGYITNIESGKSLPSLPGLLCICEQLNVTPCQFFALDVERPDKVNVILEDLNYLDSSQLDLVEALVKCLCRG